MEHGKDGGDCQRRRESHEDWTIVWTGAEWLMAFPDSLVYKLPKDSNSSPTRLKEEMRSLRSNLETLRRKKSGL